MNRRKFVCAIAGLGAVAGCTSINDASGSKSTPTTKQDPCKSPTSKPADVVRLSDSSLSLQEVRKKTDAYPNHEDGALAIYQESDGSQLVLGAYQFNSQTDAQSAADQGLSPESDVVAQLQVGRWLLLGQAPKKETAQSLVLSAGVSEGCQSELTFFGVQTGDAFTLGSNGQPWQGLVVDLTGGSPSEIRASLDSPVPAILSGETVNSAYVETNDYGSLQ